MLEDFKIRVFATVCRTLNFTAAARELDITQPAVSQNIAELERLLGVTLFNRERGKVSLTEDGEQFAIYAERILYWCARAEAKFIGGALPEDGTTTLMQIDGGTAEVYVRDGAVNIRFAGVHPEG